MLVTKIGRAQHVSLFFTRGNHPVQGAAYEQVRAHNVMTVITGHRVDVKTDQPHVVSKRHPTQADVFTRKCSPLLNTLDICNQVAVPEHDTLRITRRTRGKLDEGNVLGSHIGNLAGSTQIDNVITQQYPFSQLPVDITCRGILHARFQPGQVPAIRIQKRPAQFFRYIEYLASMLVADANGQRHRNNAAKLTRPKHVHHLLIVIQEQDQVVTPPHIFLLQQVKQTERALIQVLIADNFFLLLAVYETDVLLMAAVALQCLDQRTKLHHSIIIAATLQ